MKHFGRSGKKYIPGYTHKRCSRPLNRFSKPQRNIFLNRARERESKTRAIQSFSRGCIFRGLILVIMGLFFSLILPILPFVIAQKSSPLILDKSIQYNLIKSNLIKQNLPQKNSPQQTQTNPALELVETGKKYYDAGQFTLASQQLQQALQTFQKSGDIPQQIQVLSLLSLTQQKLGNWEQAKIALDAGFTLLTQSPSNQFPSHQQLHRIHAQILNSLGHWQLAQGQTEAALTTWEQSEKLYRQAEDRVSIIGSQINQAGALQGLGLYRRADKLLSQIETQLDQQPDSVLKATGLLNLGNIRRLNGDLQKSREILNQSLAIAQQLNLPQLKAKTWLNRGNTEVAIAQRAEELKDIKISQQYRQQALTSYQQAIDSADVTTTKVQAQLNYLSVLIDTNQITSTIPLIEQINTAISQLSPSRVSIYARVNLVKSLLKIAKRTNETQDKIQDNIQLQVKLLETAIAQARNLADQRAESYALGTLGNVYEQIGDRTKAKKNTLSALVIAQALNALDMSYQWQWQMGRLLQAEKATQQAVEYYTEAFKNISNLRSDLVALNPEIQFSFRESVEPVYRQLVDLLLQSPQPQRNNLIQARQVIEALQLAELDNYFGDACTQPKQVNIDQLDPNAAVIYPILLPNRLEIIVKLPGVGDLIHYAHPNISETQIDAIISQLQKSLKRRSTSLKELKTQSQQLYNWLIQPFADALETTKTREQSQIKNLVFVLDGSLRNLPMAFLHDGQKYLIERYAISVTPTLQLLESKPLQREKINVLIAGATDAPSFQKEGLGSIDNVAIELEGIQQNIQSHQILANQNFVRQNIQKQINQTTFNIVHFATHGKFSSNPEQTYILDWNERIKVKDLDKVLSLDFQRTANPIELLILSACETATGDKRAALGLAGVAIRAGARTTLASLWQINDASTAEFMIRFYQELNRHHNTKAEALRNTQLAFLKETNNQDYNRPYHWAAFILVGNWL